MPRKSKSATNSKSKSLTKTLNTISPIPGSPGSPSSPLSVPSSTKSNMLLFNITFGIIALIINVFALFWIMKLEAIPECKCSDTWMRLYIKYYLHVYVPVLVISLLLQIYLYSAGLYLTDLTGGLFVFFRVFVSIVVFFGFINMMIAIMFISKLKEINCECSEDIKREIYFIYNIISVSIIGISLLLMLMAFIIGAMVSMRK